MATTVNDARAIGTAATVEKTRSLRRHAIGTLLHPGRDVRSGLRCADSDVDRTVADRPRTLMRSNPNKRAPFGAQREPAGSARRTPFTPAV